jgi:hypothetical protein
MINKLVLSLLLFFPIYSTELVCGGYIPLISSVNCYNNYNIQIEPNNEMNIELAEIVINNNSPSFELILNFENNGNLVSSNNNIISPEAIYLNGADKGLGKGLIKPTNLNMLPLNSNTFIWSPGIQQTSTINYVLTINAIIKADNVISDYYYQNITALIQSNF